VTHDMFGRLIKEEWKVVKEEAARVCPIVSFEEIQKILGEYKAEGVVESEKIEGAAKPVEAKVAVSLKAQRLEE